LAELQLGIFGRELVWDQEEPEQAAQGMLTLLQLLR
jgi:hypothetical protein